MTVVYRKSILISWQKLHKPYITAIQNEVLNYMEKISILNQNINSSKSIIYEEGIIYHPLSKSLINVLKYLILRG